MEKRFGIAKAVFDDYLLFKKNKSWWFLRQSGFIRQASLLRVSVVGHKAFQRIGEYIKPTTRVIQVFGHFAVRAKLNLNSDEMKKMADGQHISTDMEIDNGYIVLSFNGAVLGLGLLIDGRIEPQIPRRDIVSFMK
jgi:hypothetical protein